MVQFRTNRWQFLTRIYRYNTREYSTKVSAYIKIQKIKARTRELEKYLCDEIYTRYGKDGIDTINRFTTRIDSFSDDEIVEMELKIEKKGLLEVIINKMRLDKFKKDDKPLNLPKIFEKIEVDGNEVTSLDELLTLIESKQTYLYAPGVSQQSRKRGIISFGYEDRHVDKSFTLMRFLCLRGYKDLLIQKQLYL